MRHRRNLNASGVQVVQDFKLPQAPNPSGSHDSEETEGSSRLSSVLIGDHPVSWLYVSGPSSDLRPVLKLLHHGDLVTKEPLSQELG